MAQKLIESVGNRNGPHCFEKREHYLLPSNGESCWSFIPIQFFNSRADLTWVICGGKLTTKPYLSRPHTHRNWDHLVVPFLKYETFSNQLGTLEASEEIHEGRGRKIFSLELGDSIFLSLEKAGWRTHLKNEGSLWSKKRVEMDLKL